MIIMFMILLFPLSLVESQSTSSVQRVDIVVCISGADKLLSLASRSWLSCVVLCVCEAVGGVVLLVVVFFSICCGHDPPGSFCRFDEGPPSSNAQGLSAPLLSSCSSSFPSPLVDF